MGKYLDRFIAWVFWLWTPTYDEPEKPEVPQPPVAEFEPDSPMDELEMVLETQRRFRLGLASATRRVEKLRAERVGERAKDFLSATRAFAKEVKHGKVFELYADMKRALDDLEQADPNFINLIAGKDNLLKIEDQLEKRFLTNFADKMSKPNTDYFTCLEYISTRRKSNNIFFQRR